MNRTKLAAVVAVPVLALSGLAVSAPAAHAAPTTAAASGWGNPYKWFCERYNPVMICR